MVKGIALAVALLCASPAFAQIPTGYTREQLIAMLVPDKITVQERSAVQLAKSRLDVAEIMQCIYQDRLDKLKEEQIQDSFHGMNNQDVLAYFVKVRQRQMDDITEWIATVKAAPAPKAKKKKAVKQPA